MKKLITVLLSMGFATSVYAADAENSGSATVDHSKNPLTGTQTTTKKWKSKKKNARGEAETNSKETTKEMTDGSTEKTTKTTTDSKSN